ncbi:MAG TPA: glycosyltransferase family 2 protein [Thermoleophilaceae bacterium]
MRAMPDMNAETGRVDASVLVPVLNEEEHIREAVEAMRAQDFEGTVELLFMDGGSTDGTRTVLEELAAEDPRIRVLDNPGRTTPHALNVGLAAARGEFVVRMDAHAFYPPRYIAAGVERLRRGDVEWVAGPAIPRGTGRWSKRVALALNSGLTTVGSRKWRAQADGGGDEVELDTGVFAGVWRRATLDEHGGWDTGWPINQDSELAARVLAAGGRIVLLPEMGAEYVPRDNLKGLARQYWRYGIYRGKTSRYHANSLRRSQLMAPGLAMALLASLGGPRLVHVPARLALGAYLASLTAVSVRVAEPGEERDAAALPVVFAIMHLTWGFGFLWSAVRFGPPLAALARLAGLGERRR